MIEKGYKIHFTKYAFLKLADKNNNSIHLVLKKMKIFFDDKKFSENRHSNIQHFVLSYSSFRIGYSG